ncbi:MAG: anthranilate synthase component I family protein [Bacteroidetes bacterium]|nr:Isochorismate synthase MenF [Flavobacteriales bacterium]NOG94901.1 anthranilate synthase component I family protein [Bacteroidota bacterium]WKZ74594.1 MAG: anthranilate synthase component I family protein [Vicingaceae bacterium]MCL4816862.1 anthranilate synthase component I family protein [Flavobacteriales bacterium]CAG0965417.1 para-aminobenzoate synthetase component I [Flavobacteriales bacterium]
MKFAKKNNDINSWKYAVWLSSEFNCGIYFPNIYYSNSSTKKYQVENKILFPILGYNLKNNFEELFTSRKDFIGFPNQLFIQPETSEKFNPLDFTGKTNKLVKLKARTTKKQYIEKVNALKQHIKRGDIYEINYCIEFFAEEVVINPMEVFCKLYQKTKAPFSCFVKCNDSYLMCASPERFLKKENSKLISQPIKGTIKRGENLEEDLLLKNSLLHNLKEQSENAMIVDLVRNDLSRLAKKASVNVEELFGIYTFEALHQMISTISCELKENTNFDDILKATFPMGSMTGAPKIRAMQLIEQYEDINRGLYSGSVGCILPNGNFDVNVVIRSIQYNAANQYLSVMVGSAITDMCNAEDEYNECLLKAEALLNTLNAELVC